MYNYGWYCAGVRPVVVGQAHVRRSYFGHSAERLSNNCYGKWDEIYLDVHINGLIIMEDISILDV